MTDPADIEADYAALNELIVNCPDFERLEAMLGGFNLFQVLKFEHGEIRHSNVLAWILDPSESHGLDATFLKKWLMRIIHEAPDDMSVPVAAVDIDGWQLLDVEVRREWKSIDLLVILNFIKGQRWVIAIENKVKSLQHSNQLSRYRSIVEAEFSAATRRMYVFLTKSDEAPEDEGYMPASYTQVHKALSESLKSRSHAIGSEPKVLLENYVRLLEEKFMNESDIAKTALRIYQQHGRALDVIFEHRPDRLRMISEGVRNLLADNSVQLGITMESSNKSYVRFLPRDWDHPGNTHGSAWPGSNRSVLLEVSFTDTQARFYAMAGKAPDSWMSSIWNLTGRPPFKRNTRKSPPKMWCTIHVAHSIKIDLDDGIQDPSEIAQKIYARCVEEMKTPEFRQVLEIIAKQMPSLGKAYADQTARSVS